MISKHLTLSNKSQVKSQDHTVTVHSHQEAIVFQCWPTICGAGSTLIIIALVQRIHGILVILRLMWGELHATFAG